MTSLTRVGVPAHLVIDWGDAAGELQMFRAAAAWSRPPTSSACSLARSLSELLVVRQRSDAQLSPMYSLSATSRKFLRDGEFV